MKKWRRIVDRLITESIGDGDVSHLPGAGKKLSLTDEGAAPEDMRVAFKIMKDHNVTPDWIEAGARLQRTEAALRSEITSRAQRGLSAMRATQAEASSTGAARRESNWRRYQERFLERVDRYNREALAHNLTLPSGIPHRPILRAEALIERALQGKDPK